MFNSENRQYSLKKSRHILKWVFGWYKKKGKTLSPLALTQLETNMAALDEAILSKNAKEASPLAKKLDEFGSSHCKKTMFEYVWELILALLFALVIATIVRQTWFELYEIPTGSMRPTFREQDHLTVTKTAFGINMPLETSHLYFDPSLVQRTSVVIWSGDGMPIPDVDTTYFAIFPYKKRYIKRMIGKPGDSLYFYGGQIYGVAKDGTEIPELNQSPWMQNLEYVPYLSFEGDMSGHVSDKGNSILFRQMYQPRGKLTFSQGGAISGEVFNGKEWIKDDPLAQNKPHKEIETYSDIFGMRNFAETRLLTKEELKAFPEGRDGNFEVAELYLQLRHTPSLNYPKPLISRGIAGGLAIPGYKAILPLQQKHLEALMDTLYTARFVVKDGRAIRYSHGDSRMGRDAVDFSGVEDGTYEFYHGKAVKIGWAGVTEEVPATSPLYSRSAANIQKLFNLGIEMSLVYQPTNGNETHYPHRYAYFRHGDLYLMGSPVVRKEDPALIAFNKREEEKVAKATNNAPYVAFKDWGAPVKDDGSIDVDFIRTFGVTLPEKSYLVLGDNHAMSADSRVFGFVPEANLQGAPCWIIWPISFAGDCRLGAPPQKPYPFMNVPRAIIWSIAGMIFLIWYCLHRRNLKKRIFIKQ